VGLRKKLHSGPIKAVAPRTGNASPQEPSATMHFRTNALRMASARRALTVSKRFRLPPASLTLLTAQ
jgi:hypothetical protein